MNYYLMRISLVRISLLRFVKTFQKYLAYAFLGLFISLMQILYVLMRLFTLNAILCELFFSLLRTLDKNLPNAIFG